VVEQDRQEVDCPEVEDPREAQLVWDRLEEGLN